MNINRHRRSVHSLYIKILCNELTHEGIAIEDSLKAAHLPLSFMEDGDGMVSIHEFHRLIEFAQTRTGSQWLGLALGKKIISNHHGPLGYLMASSPNLATAIAALVKYLALRTQLLTLELSTANNQARLTLIEAESIDTVRVIFLEAFMIITIDVLQLVFGGQLAGLRLEFAYPAPGYAALYSDYFDCPVAFSCQNNTIIFQQDTLLVNNILTDTKAFRLAEIECQNTLDRLVNHQNLKSRIEKMVLEPSNFFPTLDLVAERLCMSKSTLIRKLAKEDTSYRKLLDNIRQELANYYLIETDLSVEKIAEELGYEDTSNFSRVFQRWTHTTPSKFRMSFKVSV